MPDETEKAGFSKATKALLNPHKLQQLGWQARTDMKTGLSHTLQIMANY
ncbi:hypothetical protein [Lactiplantibacillus xiangfangensis]